MADQDLLTLQPADSSEGLLTLQNADGTPVGGEENALIHGRKADWLDKLLRGEGGVGVGTPSYPDFRNLHINANAGQKFVDPSEDPDYEARRRIALGSLAGQGAATGGLATGAPWLAALLGGGAAGATAKTPGDVAASTVAGAIPGPNFASRGLNTFLGLLRGYGMAKGADVTRAAVNQQPMPSMAPDPASIISSALGVAGGAGTGTPKVDKAAEWMEEGRNLTSQKINAKSALDAADLARKQSKVAVGRLLNDRDTATEALNAEKTATQKQLQNALADAEEKLKNAKIVGSEEYHNNQVAQAKAALAELQNKDFTQTTNGQKLAQIEKDLAPVSQQYRQNRMSLAMAQKAHADAQNALADWRNRKPDSVATDKFEKLLKAAMQHGPGTILGGLFGGFEGGHWNPMNAAIGAGAGAGASWLNNTPQGRQTLSGVPQAIPGLSNAAANLNQ